MEETVGEALDTVPSEVFDEGHLLGCELVLRLPAALWEVFGSPEFHLQLPSPDVDIVVAQLEAWRDNVILPLLKKHGVTTSRPDTPAWHPSDKQVEFLQRLADEAGTALDADGTYWTDKDAFDRKVDELKAAKPSGKGNVNKAVSTNCRKCGQPLGKPKNYRGTAEDYARWVYENEGGLCWKCRKG